AASSNRNDRQMDLPAFVRAVTHVQPAQTLLPQQGDDRCPKLSTSSSTSVQQAVTPRQVPARLPATVRSPQGLAPVDHRETQSPATTDSNVPPRCNENRRLFESASASRSSARRGPACDRRRGCASL